MDSLDNPYKPFFPTIPVQTDSGIERAALSGQTDIRLGKVTYMDYEHTQADITLMDGGTIHVTTFMSADSSRSGDSGSLPSINSYVIVGIISRVGSVEEWAVLGSAKTGYRTGQALLATKDNPETPEHNTLERQISRKTSPSEFQIMAEDGGEGLFDEGWSFLSKDLSEVKSDFITETQVSNLKNYVTQSFNGRVQQGAAVRMLPDQSGLYAHPTGLTFQYVTPDGIDPALRYKNGSTPGLVATEELHVFNDLTDLIPDPTPYIEGQHPGHTTDLNTISSLSSSKGATFTPQSTDRPPDTQVILQPVDENSYRDTPGQTLYKSDSISIQNRKDLRYTHDSNLIGAFETDNTRYLSVLVPQIMFNKYETNFYQDHQTLKDPHPHPKFRLRVPVRSEYSPLIYNQTSYYQTKEGYQMWTMGATLPTENIPINGGTTFYKGAGRSGEIFSFGGLDAVLGKTQDEEESLSLTTIGQIFAHLGADDGSNPHANRTIKGLNKITGAMQSLDIYDFTPTLTPGGNQDYTTKSFAENISMVLTTDGGLSGRFGARNAAVTRKFVYNGYSDGQGRDTGNMNSHNANRQVYGAKDSNYSFHTLSNATASNASVDPCNLGADSYSSYDPDTHGRSWDFHLCSDLFMRIGKNPTSGLSWSMDTDGGMLWWLGKDNNGRSLIVEADGGAQIHISAASNGEALNLYLQGNVNEFIDGSLTRVITGDLSEHVMGSRTVQVEGDDTLMIAGSFSPIFNDYTMMCSGQGIIGFGKGLNLSVSGAGVTTAITGPTNTFMTGAQTTNLQGACVTNIVGATSTSITGPLTTTISGAHSLTAATVDVKGNTTFEDNIVVDGSATFDSGSAGFSGGSAKFNGTMDIG